jgi:hypothetical protein
VRNRRFKLCERGIPLNSVWIPGNLKAVFHYSIFSCYSLGRCGVSQLAARWISALIWLFIKPKSLRPTFNPEDFYLSPFVPPTDMCIMPGLKQPRQWPISECLHICMWQIFLHAANHYVKYGLIFYTYSTFFRGRTFCYHFIWCPLFIRRHDIIKAHKSFALSAKLRRFTWYPVLEFLSCGIQEKPSCAWVCSC